MSVRPFTSGIAAAALAGSALALVAAAPATANPTYVPVASDVVGVGSDTSQFALNYLADGHEGVAGYNAGRTTRRLVSFDANVGFAQVVLREGATAITRPNGSGAGKKLLYGAGNNTDVDYARSSSSLNNDEKSAGLFQMPFALDRLQMAVSKNSNAPSSLTEAQIIAIYKGEVTNWSQVGGKPGVIKVLNPQSGSGTASFFAGELKRMNGGADYTLAASTVTVQEHDDTMVKNDPNAIAPFSAGRADLLGTLSLVKGFEAGRALYNVVRTADVSQPDIQAIFGADGFVCSPAARPLIEAAGFEQLATAENDGVCGEPTQETTKDFTLAEEEAASSTTTLSGSSTAPGAVRLTATVRAGDAGAAGTVQFFEGGTSRGSATVTGGQAVLALTGVTPGNHAYKAVFTPAAGSTVIGSESSVVTVAVQGTPALASAKVSETFPAKVKKGARAKGTVRVSLSTGAAASGKVAVREGAKVLGTATLRNGVATLTLKKLTKGKHRLTIAYTGSATAKPATATFSLKQL